MALTHAQDIVPAPSEDAMPHVRGARNDAFSFWKLPENWRATVSSMIESSEGLAEHFLFERYLPKTQRRPPVGMGAYYRVKRLIPESLRHRAHSLAVRARKRQGFPNWPCESALIDFWREWLRTCLEQVNTGQAWHIGFWPDAKRCCIVLTHDVESPVGLKRMDTMADMEERYGFRSAWNLPLAQFPIDWNHLAGLQARGFEFGAHGLSHDGRLFRSAADFRHLRPILERAADEHRLAGFRAPSTLRRADWIARMAFDHDSSFSDTDPYEPQPGGTCSIFPFHLGRIIELPYTMPQDHTLINLLHRDPLQVWTLKAQWIAACGGMVLLLTHPDYSGSGCRLEQYDELLKRLADFEGAWRALPSEVAAWWRRRSAMQLWVDNDIPYIDAADTAGGVAVRLDSEALTSRR
jgi:peptidoglycan/xylan/chitin deacetylase (PgdA/CDA1 family)